MESSEKLLPRALKLILTVDPKYEEEVSGCTASVSLISESKIYVVRRVLYEQG